MSGDVTVAQKTGIKREVNKQEAEKLQQYPKYAKRIGETLELTLSDGRLKTLTDRHELGREAESIMYDFVDYLEEIDHLLVRQSYYEGDAYTIVDRKSGSIQQLDDVPILSPDHKHFITVSICDAYCPNRLQVWKRQSSGGWFEMVWSFSPYDYWASGTAKWIDNTAIEVTAEIADPAISVPGKGSEKYVKWPLYLRFNQRGWGFAEK